MLARKWRPKSFSELIGQEAVRKTLTNALTQKRIHPVLLFTGPRGTGKTSTARIFAKTLRCQNKKDLTPCEKCEDCQTIQSGYSLDVLEIDGASNNGVDAVRDLRDTVNYLPSTGFYKIYIIDEVHMLSTSAFNALLKTLEEPPDHVIFIMATTAANKIPQTVLSRCQRLDFHLIPPRPLKEQLEKICRGESISIEEEALWLIAKQAHGSLRDGQSLLDQMVNFCGDIVTSDQITDVLGLTDPSLVFDILKAIIQRSEKDMLKSLHAFSVKGGEPEILFQNLIENLRDLLILKINPKNSPVLVHASEMEINHLKQLGDTSSYEDLHLVFDMLLKAERDLAFCHDKHIALEMLLLRLSQAPRVEFIAPLNLSQVLSEKDTGGVSGIGTTEGLGGKKPIENVTIQMDKKSGSEETATQMNTKSASEKTTTQMNEKTDLYRSGLSFEEIPASAGVLSSGRRQNNQTQTPKNSNAIGIRKSADSEQSINSDKQTKKFRDDTVQVGSKTDLEKSTGSVQSTISNKPNTEKFRNSHSGKSVPLQNGSLIRQVSKTELSRTQRGDVHGATSNPSFSTSSTPISKRKWFSFVEFVRTKDPKLAALIEVLSPKSGNGDTVTFLFPEKMSFLKQLTEPKTHHLLENLLTEFMSSKKKLKIQFQNSKNPSPSLWEQRRDDEAKALRDRAVTSPFVQTVNRVFKGKIKSVSKMETDQ